MNKDKSLNPAPQAPPPPTAPGIHVDLNDKSVATYYISTNKAYKDHGIVTHETEDVDVIQIRMPPADVALAKIAVSSKMGINMGNYETIQFTVSIELPCVVEEIEDAFNAAQHLVDSRLNKQVADVRAYRDSRNKQTS